MQRLVLAMFLAVFLIPFFVAGDGFGHLQLLPAAASLIPEAMSALALCVVVMRSTSASLRNIPAKYLIAMSALLLLIVCGAILNQVSPGAVVSGFRLYFRAIPWFFIPLVYTFSDAELRTQLRTLLVLLAVQVPVAIAQRIQTQDPYYGFVMVTGDLTRGTVGDSGILSVALISATCVLVAFRERHLLRLWPFLFLFAVLLLPTTINETKVTVFLLPLGLLVAVLVSAEAGTKARKLLVALGLIAVFGAAYVPIYNRMSVAGTEADSPAITLQDFFSDSDRVSGYLSSDPNNPATEGPGRIDSIVVPFQSLATDPVTLAFGYGVGNASDSSLGDAFSGGLRLKWRGYIQSVLSRVLLELGVLGVTVVVIILALVFRDALAVARRREGLMGAIAGGWAGVVAVMLIAMPYSLLESFPALSYLFWYFSGLVAAERLRPESAPAAFVRRHA